MKLEHETILQMLKEINSQEEIARREAELKNHSVYEGDLEAYVQKEIETKYPRTHKDYTIASYNLLKKITNKKAKAYKKEPLRKLQGNELEDYKAIINQGGLNDAMKLVDRYHNQHRYCAIGVIRDRVVVENIPKDTYSFWALAPYEFVVHRDDNGEIYAWSIPVGKKGDYYHWTMWSDESHLKVRTKDYKSFELVEIPNNPNLINPYGVIPFIYVPADASGAYPKTSTLVSDSIKANVNLSIYLTSGNQQIGQLVIKHPKEQKIENVTMGLRTAMDLPQVDGETKTEAEYIAPSPNLDGHKDSVLTLMMLILDENGISTSKIGSLDGEKFTSGFDRLIANADVQDIIEENQGIYAKIENSIYQIIKAMHVKENRHTFKTDELGVTFTLPEIMLSDSEKLDNLKKKKDLGLWFDWELIQEANPNLSKEEAQAKAEALKPKPVVTNVNNEESSLQDA